MVFRHAGMYSLSFMKLPPSMLCLGGKQSSADYEKGDFHSNSSSLNDVCTSRHETCAQFV